jgi:hypothetical protein
MEGTQTHLAVKKYLAQIGGVGGRAGTGESKKRGDTGYYKKISALAAEARKTKKEKRY